MTDSANHEKAPKFKDYFFPNGNAVSVKVPDYQRAFSWELKQINLFIQDLADCGKTEKPYYFGHFIVESDSEGWDIVDGQQRITTFVLFLMICRNLCDSQTPLLRDAFTIIDRFSTVGYDNNALKFMYERLPEFLPAFPSFNEKKPPTDLELQSALSPGVPSTRSQRQMALALLRFQSAFIKGQLNPERIEAYVEVIMNSHCSLHLTHDKSVAVNIFEMHNTRGVPLTTLEILKAMLMKFVYDNGGPEKEQHVRLIQKEFGEIYGMEESMSISSFRCETTMDQLLRLHLRVVDDGNKETAHEFSSPPMNASSEDLIKYVRSRLHFRDLDKGSKVRSPDEGVKYAIDLARELRKSVVIISQILPRWDKEHTLIGDVIILEKELSYQFFLLVCRLFESQDGKADGRIDETILGNWEKLLFTRDFHGAYYWKRDKDNFESLFESCIRNAPRLSEVIEQFLKDGFRPNNGTSGLQGIVRSFVTDPKNTEQILKNAYYWWRHKMIYTIYKYEVSKKADIRYVMKGTISVEHILPQEWQWEWIEGWKNTDAPPKDRQDELLKDIGGFINGLGNLLLLTPGENASVGNTHPADKNYERYCIADVEGAPHQDREKWRSSESWKDLIQTRGEDIYNFMLKNLIGIPVEAVNPSCETEIASA